MLSTSVSKYIYFLLVSIVGLKYIIHDKLKELQQQLRELDLQVEANELQRAANELVHLHNKILLTESLLLWCFFSLVILLVLYLVIYLKFDLSIDIFKPFKKTFNFFKKIKRR